MNIEVKITQKTRDNMIHLLGQLDAARFPMTENFSQGYFDLIDSIREQYVKILREIMGFTDE